MSNCHLLPGIRDVDICSAILNNYNQYISIIQSMLYHLRIRIFTDFAFLIFIFLLINAAITTELQQLCCGMKDINIIKTALLFLKINIIVYF